jgi:hypothetical protein
MSLGFTCPCCGCAGLEEPPYERFVGSHVSSDLEPPYAQYFGVLSYEVCDCCGFEFGNDDEPSTGAPVSFDSYRNDWIKRGATWQNPAKMPPDWSLGRQLELAGIPNPR